MEDRGGCEDTVSIWVVSQGGTEDTWKLVHAVLGRVFGELLDEFSMLIIFVISLVLLAFLLSAFRSLSLNLRSARAFSLLLRKDYGFPSTSGRIFACCRAHCAIIDQRILLAQRSGLWIIIEALYDVWSVSGH